MYAGQKMGDIPDCMLHIRRFSKPIVKLSSLQIRFLSRTASLTFPRAAKSSIHTLCQCEARLQIVSQ